MDYLKNHCWCSKSHWDGEMFDCQIIVSLSSYREDYAEDWKNLIQPVEVFSQEKMDENTAFARRCMEKYPSEGWEREINNKLAATRMVPRLKPEVMKWLEDNITDFKGEKGWCVGSDTYNMNDGSGYSIFMQRRSDAMKFIKTWSKWKKPIYYTQYFTDVRKKLDLTTLKYNNR